MKMRAISMCEMLKLLGQMAPRNLWLGGAALAALTVLMGMALLGLSGWFITATALAGLVPATALVFDVFMPSAGIRLLAVGRTGARYAERLVTHDATLAVLAALRQRLFLSWARPQGARLLLQRPARLLQRLTSDVDALDNLYLRLLVPAVAALGAALLAALAYGFMRWWLGLLTLAWLLLAGWGIALWHGLRSRKAAVRRAMALETMRAQTVDLVAGQTELLMAGQLPAQVQQVLHSDARCAQADERLYQSEAAAAQAYGAVSAITLSVSVLLMAWLMEQGRINAPVAALGILMALSAMEPFAALRRGAEQAGRTWLALRRLAPPLAAKAEVAGKPQQPEQKLAVSLQAVRLRQLGPIDLNVRQGERVALIGSSGAGKTSLLHLMAGELQPDEGVVQARSCSWMTQRTELFQDSLRNNLRLADAAADDEQLWGVLQAAGLRSDVMALPQGLDTMLGEGGMGLSGGQSRRLALARLLLSPDRCWLLDEVTEGLDAVTAADVLKRLVQAAESGARTLIFATHWQREASFADRIVYLQAGRVRAQALRGTPEFEQLMARLRPDALGAVAPQYICFSD
ncbi:amino acid ABC transporter ATP-binding/permease protein [Comamonas testosteroni]|uniref:Probable ABC transporter ATP-binding protein HI_0664 n=1 Tax=Comamonas testosteroni TaxID=285 RepID=A0A8B4S745_COMTE|nr:ATP-binding cassette domain-containing protein [Comamonas testosteroni]EHN66297.1 transporter [Comamonas testosteroni ATCC 11996]QQN67870.1 ATP-binding cassette domain-containing protein [Comamonas testosteroni]SUY78932.1 Probable ABC transporter ATP-binding protein HI_0664 [Comamonas testosteroni]